MQEIPATIYPQILQYLNFCDVAALSSVSAVIRQNTRDALPKSAREDLVEARIKQDERIALRRRTPALKLAAINEMHKTYPYAIIAIEHAIMVAGRVSTRVGLSVGHFDERGETVRSNRLVRLESHINAARAAGRQPGALSHLYHYASKLAQAQDAAVSLREDLVKLRGKSITYRKPWW